jgi:hypothetical protein
MITPVEPTPDRTAELIEAFDRLQQVRLLLNAAHAHSYNAEQQLKRAQEQEQSAKLDLDIALCLFRQESQREVTAAGAA